MENEVMKCTKTKKFYKEFAPLIEEGNPEKKLRYLLKNGASEEDIEKVRNFDDIPTMGQTTFYLDLLQKCGLVIRVPTKHHRTNEN